MTIPNGQASGVVLARDAEEVRRLLEKGNPKKAVDAAKSLHKRVGTAETEALLVEAYSARVRDMLEHRMTVEAEVMISMLRQRFPESAARFDGIGKAASFEERVRPLGDPAATAEDRAAAERFIRTSLTDPAELAQCPSLAADHPLRRGAEAVQKALEAVTSRPVEDATLALPEISRRGPLAPWKPLVRAIACYHRHEDAACAEHLRAIDPESVPARLIPAIQAMLTDGKKSPSKPSARALATRAGGNLEEVRVELARLDRTFDGEQGRKRIMADIRHAVAVVRPGCPEILVALRQQIAVRCITRDLRPPAVAEAMGGAAEDDAQFRLLAARSLEATEALAPMACHMWDQFRQAAIQEGWFPERGPETATLYLHMAELAAKFDEPDFDDDDEFDDEVEEPDFSAGALRRSLDSAGFDTSAMPYLQAGWLYEQACAMDSSAESFERWVDWAQKEGGPQKAEVAAQAWRRALPEDPRPLLRLMRYAEDRDALKKALGYLRQAEALDGVNAEVRRARLRLLISGAVRHLRQGKPRLAAPELAELESLPQARENDRPAFLVALRFIASQFAADEKAHAAGMEIQGLLGSELAGAMALAAVGTLCGVNLGVHYHKTPGTWLEAIPRVIGMGQDLGFRFVFPETWKPEVLKELKGLRKPDPLALERLGKAAKYQEWDDVAYRVSAMGLELRPAYEARFLILRAMALPPFEFQRREECLLAAMTLAKRLNDPEPASAALDIWRGTSMAGSLGIGPPTLDNRQLKNLLNRERRAKEPDAAAFEAPDFEFDIDSIFGPMPRSPQARPGRGRGRTQRGPAGPLPLFDDDCPF